MKIVFLLHGVAHKPRPDKGMNKLRPYFEARGYLPVFLYYGWTFSPVTRWLNRAAALVLTALTNLLVELGHTVVAGGHSNGARVIALASEYGALFKVVFFINGAVSRRVTIGQQVDAVLNYHTGGDNVLLLTAIFPVLQWWLGWGLAGRDGVDLNQDTRIFNADMGDADLWGGARATDHNDWDDAGNIEAFGPKIALGCDWAMGLARPEEIVLREDA